jgi:sigma-B regulation protein RsbU (phosphoserine phosphatase)
MQANVFERVREGLLEKRLRLTDFLRTAPPPEIDTQLGSASKQDVEDQLQVIDTALQKTADHTIGICTVCHDYVDGSLLEMDYTSCVCLDHFSEAEKRQLETELELSQVINKALLPQQVPSIPGVDVAAFSRPAQIIGGDYFDFFQFADGTAGFAVADIAGHGVSASMLIASVQAALRTLVPEYSLSSEILQRMNKFFLHNIHFTTFVTLFLGRYDPSTEKLFYSNAGHNPPLLVHHGGNGAGPSWLKPTGAAIGLVEDFHISEEAVSLSSGDLLVLYTDGVTEAMNDQHEQFGSERLSALVQRFSHLSSRDVVKAIRLELQQFSEDQPPADDTTILAFKVT